MGNKILALDASSGACSACVAEDGEVLASVLINRGLTHSQTLLPAIDRVLSEAEIEMSDISLLVVTVGPGSFTGLKIGVSTAKGLAFPYGTECAALSSLLPLAYAFREKNGIVCAALDARRNMFYNALFRCENGRVTRLCEDRQIAAADLVKELEAYDCAIYFSGDGSALIYEAAGKKENMLIDPDKLDIRADFAAAAVFAGEGNRLPAERLVPEYLRPPQAERERLERLKAQKQTPSETAKVSEIPKS